MKEVRGSNSGFIINGEVITSDPSGCLRTVLIRDLKLPEELPNTSFSNVMTIGAFNEDAFFALAHFNGVPTLLREELLTEVISDKVIFTGHADFMNGDTVYETKSITSKRVHAAVIKKGVYKVSNLAQLVRYMLVSNRLKGELVYTSYIDKLDYSELSFLNKKEVISRAMASAGETRKFIIEIAQDGAILVDRELTPFHVQHSWEHLHQAAEFLVSSSNLPPRPARSVSSDPCFFCPLKAVCETSPATKKEFLELATATILSKEPI